MIHACVCYLILYTILFGQFKIKLIYLMLNNLALWRKHNSSGQFVPKKIKSASLKIRKNWLIHFYGDKVGGCG